MNQNPIFKVKKRRWGQTPAALWRNCNLSLPYQQLAISKSINKLNPILARHQLEHTANMYYFPSQLRVPNSTRTQLDLLIRHIV